MNIEKRQNIEYLCKCISYSTELICYCFHNDEFFFSTKRNSLLAHKVLFDEYQKISILDRNTKYQIATNDYKETFYIVNIKQINVLVIIGPFLLQEISIGTITNMIRDRTVPFHKKTELIEYYKTLPIFNEDKVFYISKIIENMFDRFENNMKNDDTIHLNTSKYKDADYQKMNQKRIDTFSHSSYANEQKISETIKNGDKENAKRILQEINLYPHAKLAIDEIRSYKNSMICSCTFMTRAAIAGGVNPDEAFTLSDAYINRIENIQNINELENFEAIMVEGFIEKVNAIKTNKYSRPILNAMNFINDHLCEDIKIGEIAKYTYLNPSYLSNLFHKETNITISEWILRKRIEEASYVVANTNQGIADIAFFYNFCSQSYFVKCFKKVIGVTPGEYRKNKMKDAN